MLIHQLHHHHGDVCLSTHTTASIALASYTENHNPSNMYVILQLAACERGPQPPDALRSILRQQPRRDRTARYAVPNTPSPPPSPSPNRTPTPSSLQKNVPTEKVEFCTAERDTRDTRDTPPPPLPPNRNRHVCFTGFLL